MARTLTLLLVTLTGIAKGWAAPVVLGEGGFYLVLVALGLFAHPAIRNLVAIGRGRADLLALLLATLMPGLAR